jgi:hypothetical protein
MAGQILEAELRITGSDKTGAAFAGVLKHAQELKSQIAGLNNMRIGGADFQAAAKAAQQAAVGVRNLRIAEQEVTRSVVLGNAALETRIGLIGRMQQRWQGVAQNLGYIAGPAVLMGTRKMVSSGADIQSKKVNMQAAGIPDAEIAATVERGGALTSLYPNISLAEILERYKELRSVLAHTEEAPQLIGPAIQAASAMKALGLSTEGLPFAYKTAEVEGLAQDPNRFRNFLDAYVKAVQVMGATITPEAMLRGAQQLKASAALLSDRFKDTTYLSMLQGMGTRAGAGVNDAIAQMLGNFQGQHSAAKQFVALGLANEGDFDKTKTGQIMGLKPGRHIKDLQMATHDLDFYVWKKLVPAMVAHGYTTMEQQVAEAMRLFPDKRAGAVIAQLIQQQASYENHGVMYGKAHGLNGTDLIPKNTIAAFDSFTTALKSLAGVAASPIMPVAAQALSNMAHGLGAAQEWALAWQKRNPQAGEIAATGAIVGGLYYGTKLSYGLLRGVFGGGAALRGSAAALTSSAAALDAAAARLGGGSVAKDLAKVAAGGAVVGAGVVTALTVGTVGQAYIMSQYPEYFDTDNPYATDMAHPYRYGGDEHLTDRNRGQITLDDIHAAIYGGDAAKPGISGSADITNKITVEPSPDFITRIETMISNALHGISVNGVLPTGTTGSVGTSMPEVNPAGRHW